MARRSVLVRASKGQDEQKEGIWTKLLKANSPDDVQGYVLCLGASGVGKRSLITLLQEETTASKDSGCGDADYSFLPFERRVGPLDYAYVEMKSLPDDEHEIDTRAHVWILDDPVFSELLEKQLQPQMLARTVAMVCVNLGEAPSVIAELQQWLELLVQKLKPVMQQLPLEAQDQLRERVLLHCCKKGSGDDEEPELGNGCLVYNLGVPVVVCVRTDQKAALDRQKPGLSKAVLCWIRKTVLPYGATVVEWDCKPGAARAASGHAPEPTAQTLYEYLRHLLYLRGQDRKPDAPQLSREAMRALVDFTVSEECKDKVLFLRSRDDAEDKIEAATKDTPADKFAEPYEVMCPPPADQSEQQKEAVEAEPMAAFLQKAKETLAKGGATLAPKTVRARPTELLAQGRRHVADKAKAGGVAGPGGATDNASLANFFQNLLTRGGPKDGKPGGLERSSTTTKPKEFKIPPRPAAGAPAEEK